MNEIEIASGTKDVQSNNRWYIAQYTDATSNFNAVHSIIHQDVITWAEDNLSQENPKNVKGQQIYVRTAATVHRPGHIIYVAESYSDAWHQLRKLKIICFQMIYARPIMDLRPHCHEWMLVQYESEFNCITYSIVNTNVVIEEKHNLYDNIVTKIIINNNQLHNAAIIRMSNDTVELIEALHFMKQKCIDSNAPEGMVPMPLVNENNAGEVQNAAVEAEATSQELTAMELTMHAECRALITAFEKIHAIRMNLQRREYNLNMTQLLYNID